MSTLKVTAERLVIHPHHNADALELAQVGLFRAVVAKGAFQTGDHAIYIPEGAVLPEALIEELGLTGKLAGPAHDRVKAVRLRGELSQGIVCRPAELAELDLAEVEPGTDFAERLGITKWVPPIPVHMSGDITPAPELLPWVEVENIKRYPDIFTAGEPVIATEKIHGTACLLTYVVETGEVFVSSKGFGKQHLAIKEAATNLYWRAIVAHKVAVIAAELASSLGATRIGVFGEVYGQGVQDLAYGADASRSEPGYAAFDIAAEIDGEVRWLSPDGTGLPSAPVLYTGPYDEALLIELAGGVETVSGRGTHIREGVVVRSATERYSPVLGGRAIGKFVSDAYLTRKGGTEYE
ncbi:RNA ligase (TIGR02306 family) [Allocatelliglobosispora scoriae]|uniref:RNA ligase (TIGR02306 family) n=1 Tax=Allocatelliglobosispora scoriae TaxID=643052 RepID=A0A841BTD8_9ACTN|nr:RNA ligase (ATP) [Allocatelliglobosispora scoriae]MBB5872347.1 RNA ligase (TIGR02306 family) [Allocatelliglobosispora scoriae]